MSLIIETIVCVCGHVLTIETDTQQSLRESKEKFEQEHRNCEKKIKSK